LARVNAGPSGLQGNKKRPGAEARFFEGVVQGPEGPCSLRASGAEARGFLRSFRRATHALRGFPARALIQGHHAQRRWFTGLRIETRGTPCRGGLTGAGRETRTTAGLETGATGRQGLKPADFLRSFRRATHTLCGFPGRALIQSHRIQRR